LSNFVKELCYNTNKGDIMKKLKIGFKKVLQNIYIQHGFILAGIFFSLLTLDIMLRYFSNQYILVYRFTHASPLFFSISWIFLFTTICYLLPKKGKMIFYGLLSLCFNILTLAQILHMKTLNRFFGLSDVFLVGEGSEYFGFALKKIDGFTIGVIAVSLIATIITLIMIKRAKEFPKTLNYYLIVLSGGIMLFSGFHFLAIERLGQAVDTNGWEQAYNVKNIYLDFNNQGKNMEVAGLYEQTFRNSYLYIKNFLNTEQETINEELDAYFEKETIQESEENSYTGIFKGKNMIFVLLESVDSWLVNEEVMPTLTRLEKEGWNFTNRYAPTFGGGQTINSEFAANTGLYALDNSKVIYNFDTNVYPYSIANQMKKNGYIVESIHANTAKFYNRSNFHKVLGYSKHYALSDMKELDTSFDYFLDSSLIKNEDVFDLIVKEKPYMTFVTTYSAHLPYDNENPNCSKDLYHLEGENKELSCIYNLAHDTDEFLKLLLEKLEETKQIDDTVLVLFTDHYMYGYSNTEYMLNWKKVDNMNLIQNVPFVIWSNDIKHKNVDTIMDTADIPPTILNLFGISYPKNFYVGTDVFSKEHEPYVYFSNNVFYDGELYYDGKDKMTEENKEYVQDTLITIQNKMKMNEQIILGNYFQYLEKKRK